MKALDIRRVVAPIDLDELAENGFALALELASAPENVHVVVAVVGGLGSDPTVATADARSRLKSWLDSQGAPDSVRTHVAVGRPADVIVDVAGVVQADLVVMPSHGRTGVPRLLQGSVAEEVVRRATCAVLVLRTAQGTATAV